MHHDKDPTGWTSEVWALAIAMALLGGIVSVLQKLPCGRGRPFGFVELASEMVTSGFVGVLAFMAMEGMDMPLGVCAAGSGVAGHMATRLLFLVENTIEKKLNKKGNEA